MKLTDRLDAIADAIGLLFGARCAAGLQPDADAERARVLLTHAMAHLLRSIVFLPRFVRKGGNHA